MDITEYIYIDRRRLETYFQQVSSPVQYDKISVWKVALGLTGPSAEGTQQRQGRPFTEHEKISRLVEVLSKSADRDGQKSFHVHTCFGRRVILSGAKSAELPGVAVWMCRQEKSSPVQGYLVESPHYDDDKPLESYTGVAALQLLIPALAQASSQQVAQSLRQDRRIIAEISNLPIAWWDDLSKESEIGMAEMIRRVLIENGITVSGELSIRTFSNHELWKSFNVSAKLEDYTIEMTMRGGREKFDLIVKENCELQFERNPAGAFASAGFRIEAERKIDCLFRVRIQSLHGYVGYPIFIAVHPSQFSSSQPEQTSTAVS